MDDRILMYINLLMDDTLYRQPTNIDPKKAEGVAGLVWASDEVVLTGKYASIFSVRFVV